MYGYVTPIVNWCSQNNPQIYVKGIVRIGNQKTRGDYYINFYNDILKRYRLRAQNLPSQTT